MTAPVRIEAAAWGDLRFATLARLCGFADAEHALIKVAKIWAWQTEHYTPESPTYVVDLEIIESALGPGGAAHLVRARLAEEGPDGFRIRGSKGRIEWLHKRRVAAPLGGEATKRKHSNKARPHGLPDGQPDAGPDEGPDAQPSIGPLPLPLSLDRSPEDTYTRARDRHPASGRIVEAVWKLGMQRCGELKIAKIPSVAPWPAMAPTDSPGRLAIVDRIGELLATVTPEEAQRVALNRVEVAYAKAVADHDGGFFAPLTMFTPNSFASWAHLDPKQFTRKAPKKREDGALIGAADPRSDHGVGFYNFSDFNKAEPQ